MEMKSMQNYLLSLMFCLAFGISAEVVKAKQGEILKFQYKDLPEHRVLELSFYVHILGGWDGTTYDQWSPDRFFCKLDDMTLVDSTFNNCHLTFIDNIWQSFPDPYHKDQLNFQQPRKSYIDGTYLYHGGRGASEIATLGFQWSNKPSVDSVYHFRFLVLHSKKTAVLEFGTKWKESPQTIATYHLEYVNLEPLTTKEDLLKEDEEKAWLSFFSGSPEASQKAWQEIYVTHPEKLIKRVDALLKGEKKRRSFLIQQLSEGKTPTEAIFQEVNLDPNGEGYKKQSQRILYLRELALGKKSFNSKQRQEIWGEKNSSDKLTLLRKIGSIGSYHKIKNCVPLQKTRMRLSAYLRMMNSKKSLALAKKIEAL